MSTYWNFRLVVFFLLIFIFLFLSSCKSKRDKSNYDLPNYKLELHIENWVDGSPIKSLPIEFLHKGNDAMYRVTLKKTDENGVVVVTLQKGDYLCRVIDKSSWTGGVEIELAEDTTAILKVLSVLR